MNNNTPICPKCGYDQSGEIATWEDQCPLEGRCPECGLGFAWAEVLAPVPKCENKQLDRVILWSLFIVLISILAYGAFERWLAQLG